MGGCLSGRHAHGQRGLIENRAEARFEGERWVAAGESGGVGEVGGVVVGVGVGVLAAGGVAEGVVGEELGGLGVVPAGAHVDEPGGGVGVLAGVPERGDEVGGFDGGLVAVWVVVVERERPAVLVGERADRAELVGVVVGDGAAGCDLLDRGPVGAVDVESGGVGEDLGDGCGAVPEEVSAESVAGVVVGGVGRGLRRGGGEQPVEEVLGGVAVAGQLVVLVVAVGDAEAGGVGFAGAVAVLVVGVGGGRVRDVRLDGLGELVSRVVAGVEGLAEFADAGELVAVVVGVGVLAQAGAGGEVGGGVCETVVGVVGEALGRAGGRAEQSGRGDLPVFVARVGDVQERAVRALTATPTTARSIASPATASTSS